MRIVVSCPNWIGDAVMATPALAALRARHADAHLALLARPYVIPVVSPSPYVDAILPWGRPGGPGTCAVVRQLRRERFDLGILLTNSFRSALVFRLGGVRRRVGYARDLRSPLLTDRVKPLKAKGAYVPAPVLRSYLDLVGPPATGEVSIRMHLYTTPSDESAADRLYAALGLEASRTLVMAPGAAFGQAKCWPPDRFSRIARRAGDELGLRTLVLCAPAERETAAAIAEASAGAAVVAPEPLPGLNVVKAVVRRARVMVTNDSGLRHFAAAYSIPVVTIFGPTDPRWTETWFPKETKLQATVPCGPCQRRVCREGHLRCMTDVTPAMVFGALAGALGKSPYEAPGEETVIGPADRGGERRAT